jgi:hypothetical protein
MLLLLVVGSVAAALVDVALLHTDFGRSAGILDVVAKLSEVNLTVKEFIVSVATPTLAELQNASHSVLVFSGLPFASNGALGDVLADFVDTGGNVVVMYSAQITYQALHLAGRFESAGMHPIFAASFAYNDGPRKMVKVLASHPLLSGVSSFDGGQYSYRADAKSVSSGALLVANWSTGEPLVAVHEPRTKFNGSVVSLSFTPQSSDYISLFWNSTTDGARLMANAVRFGSDVSNTATLPPVQSIVPTPTAAMAAASALSSTGALATNTTSVETTAMLATGATPNGPMIGGVVGGAIFGLGLLVVVSVYVVIRTRARHRPTPSPPVSNAVVYADVTDVRSSPSNKL